MIRFAALVAVMLTSAAFAGPELKFPAFTGINVHGGAHVVLRHGNVQRVTVTKGDAGKADLHMSGTSLDISPCKNWCWNVGPFEVEIVSPKIDAVEAHGGGALEAVGEFPHQGVLTVAAHGGGAIDTRAIPADTVTAAAHGGGAVHVRALNALVAAAHGGGAISYAGNPPKVVTQTGGGGAISKE